MDPVDSHYTAQHKRLCFSNDFNVKDQCDTSASTLSLAVKQQIRFQF